MTDKEREEILQAMQDERNETIIAQKARKALDAELDAAISLYAHYAALMKAGFDDKQAFSLVMQRSSIILSYTLERGFEKGFQ